jgi:hypothetical protein
MFGLTPAVIGPQIGAAFAVAGIGGILLPSIATSLWKGDLILRPLRVARMFAVLGILPCALQIFVREPWQLLVLAAMQYALGMATAAGLPGVIQDLSPPGLRSRILSMVTMVTATASAISAMLVGGLSSLFTGAHGILIAVIVVGVPGWLWSVALFTLATRTFTNTVEEIRREPSGTLPETSVGAVRNVR